MKRKISCKGGSAPSRGYVGLGHEKTSRVAPIAGLKDAKDVRARSVTTHRRF